MSHRGDSQSYLIQSAYMKWFDLGIEIYWTMPALAGEGRFGFLSEKAIQNLAAMMIERKTITDQELNTVTICDQQSR